MAVLLDWVDVGRGPLRVVRSVLGDEQSRKNTAVKHIRVPVRDRLVAGPRVLIKWRLRWLESAYLYTDFENVTVT